MTEPQAGDTAELRYVVRDDDTAAALTSISGDRFPAVLATTKCIALLELAAGKILARGLDEGQLSVGVTVDVTHTAATPVGAEVVAFARYTGRDGKLFAFEVSLRDPAGEVMKGTHKRAVIDEQRLLSGAAKRGGQVPGSPSK